MTRMSSVVDRSALTPPRTLAMGCYPSNDKRQCLYEPPVRMPL